MSELVTQVTGDVVHPFLLRSAGRRGAGVLRLASRPHKFSDARHYPVALQRAFFVARFRGGVSRSAMVAIAVGTSR
ncbi:hypothetical protein GCM10009828_006930 [Actinoplanes couchii]|uniref:Uncharacterized protein n=1 Tax=Actinoplanes couchii TaxID=403638 RepID=A0ABQ3XJQ1_9ACTN|nr:hypothetical protein Aco03nite_071320 [Actinoplanes couchii]